MNRLTDTFVQIERARPNGRGPAPAIGDPPDVCPALPPMLASEAGRMPSTTHMNAVADLGTIDGDVLAFGGVVSNAHAALLRLAGKRGFEPRQMVSTGDIAAYCGQPARCVSAMRALGVPSICGNCEESLAAGAADCGCGFAPGSVCDLLSVAWYAHADRQLGPAARAWTAGLPRFAVFRAHGRRWGVLHGGVTRISRFLWPTTQEACFAEEITAFDGLPCRPTTPATRSSRTGCFSRCWAAGGYDCVPAAEATATADCLLMAWTGTATWSMPRPSSTRSSLA